MVESSDNHQSSPILNNNGTSNETMKRNEKTFKPSVLGKCTRCRLMSNSLFEVKDLIYRIELKSEFFFIILDNSIIITL